MREPKYIVLLDGFKVAENMSLDMALILAKGIFAEYHNQAATVGMMVSIESILDDEPPKEG